MRVNGLLVSVAGHQFPLGVEVFELSPPVRGVFGADFCWVASWFEQQGVVVACVLLFHGSHEVKPKVTSLMMNEKTAYDSDFIGQLSDIFCQNCLLNVLNCPTLVSHLM